jgi:hypothetical protein
MKTKTINDFEIGQIVRHTRTTRAGIILQICERGHWPNDPHFLVHFTEYKVCVSPSNLEPVRLEPRYIIDLWTRRSPVAAST